MFKGVAFGSMAVFPQIDWYTASWLRKLKALFWSLLITQNWWNENVSLNMLSMFSCSQATENVMHFPKSIRQRNNDDCVYWRQGSFELRTNKSQSEKSASIQLTLNPAESDQNLTHFFIFLPFPPMSCWDLREFIMLDNKTLKCWHMACDETRCIFGAIGVMF